MSRAEEAAGPEDPARRPASPAPLAVDLGSAAPRPCGRGRPPRFPVLQMGKLWSLESNELIQDLVEGLDWPILHGGQRGGSPHPFPADLPSILFQDLVMHPGSADCVPGPGHGTGNGVNQTRLGPSGETGGGQLLSRGGGAGGGRLPVAIGTQGRVYLRFCEVGVREARSSMGKLVAWRWQQL